MVPHMVTKCFETLVHIDFCFQMCLSGHYFWDNGNGANAFCRKLGYDGGIMTNEKDPGAFAVIAAR